MLFLVIIIVSFIVMVITTEIQRLKARAQDNRLTPTEQQQLATEDKERSERMSQRTRTLQRSANPDAYAYIDHHNTTKEA